MELEQIAVHANRTFDQQALFGFYEWSLDMVTAKGILKNGSQWDKIENTAELRFNYCVFPGKEFELIHYHEGPNFLSGTMPGAMSHFGVHVTSINAMKLKMEKDGFDLVQEVVTQSHSNHKVPKDRRYHYAIYRHVGLGFHWKLIQRILDIHAEQELEKIYDLL